MNAASLALPPQSTTASKSGSEVAITVLDENGVAVQFAQATLTGTGGTAKCETDYAGHCEIAGLKPGSYQLRVEKEGFFVLTKKDVDVGTTEAVDVTLNHQHELVKTVNVVYSPPLIDPEKTTLSNTLSSHDIIDLPSSVPRDIRYSLPLLPGVLPDATAQVHVDGSDSPQTIYLLDGFTLNAPESRYFLTRVSVDAIRSVTLQNSRYPAEYGGGTGGVLDLTTGMGDDHFRFAGTDFLPSLAFNKGFHIGSWIPRFLVSGPLHRGKAWFLVAPEGEYSQNIINELPPGQDEVTSWRYGVLSKAQVNLASSNILTGTVLINGFGENHAGLSLFNPLPTTLDLRQSNDLLAVKDQAFLSKGMLFEVGLAATQFYSHQLPQGDQTYVIGPNGNSGNYFETAIERSKRLEGVTGLTVPLLAEGRHELKFGGDLERITYDASYVRNPFEIERTDGTLAREASFVGPSAPVLDNFAVGTYAQDRWSISKRFTFTPGVRLDWDEIVRDVLVSPRLAATYLLERGGETRLVGGVGVYYDSTDLNLLSLPLAGQRVDVFYNSAGTAPAGPPVTTSFQTVPGTLQEFKVLNWSAGVERKLPGSIDVDFEFLEKNGFAYYNQCTVIGSCLNGTFTLHSQQQTNYHAARITVRKQFRGDHLVFASYTESRANANAVINFGLDNPVFSPQLGGPQPWDSPHRLISWGFLPLIRGYDLAYTVDARSGYPFYLVNQNQQLVAPPGSGHYPAYFSLDLALEKRFGFFGFLWALRAGFNDITNRQNATAVNNNVDSPQFLTYGGIQGRVLTAQIRLVGRK